MSKTLDEAAALAAASLPADGAVVALGGTADAELLARVRDGGRELAASAAVDGVAAGATVLLGAALASPDQAATLQALRTALGDDGRVVAVVANAGHADRRVAALAGEPEGTPALTLAALRDRLEAAGFAVEHVHRVRRAGAHPGAVLGASAGILARFLAEDPDATVDWYVVEAGASAAAAELAAARGRVRELEAAQADVLARARELADAEATAEIARLRQALAEQERHAAASARQAAHERETLHAQLDAARARVQELEAMVAELQPLASASRDAAARAAQAEDDLHALTGTTAYRAIERYWRLKGRVVGS